MAVDATYMNLLPSQLLTNREIMRPNNLYQQQQQQQQQQNQLLNSAMYNAQMNSSAMAPETAATTALMANNNNQQSLLPFYQSNNMCDPNKADSGLTYHQQHHIPLQRKRSRDFTTEFTSLPSQQKNKLSSSPPSQQQPFINLDILFQFQNQTQSELDRVLAHHTEKVRMELEEQKLRQSRVLLSVLQETMAKKMKEKEEEIHRMEKLNMALQERVKTLCVENQVWRELAQANETTANNLRSNLELVLAHVGEDRNAAVLADDAESCCGSNDIGGAVAAEAERDTAATPVARGGGEGVRRMCRSCGVRESIVLLLPCRHLCLCTMCGSSIRNCPVCDSGMDASVHVNLA